MIVVKDKVLSEQECKVIVSVYESFKENAHEWNGTKPLNFKFIPKEVSNLLINKLQKLTNSIFKDVVYDWGEIVKWHKTNYQNLHLDATSDKTILTSITYLNDNFEGGETYFQDGSSITPVMGRTLIFNGRQYVHGVKEIKEGIRWTVPIWYKKREEQNV